MGCTEVSVAINLIVHHVQTQLDNRGFRLRGKLANNFSDGQPLPETVQENDTVVFKITSVDDAAKANIL